MAKIIRIEELGDKRLDIFVRLTGAQLRANLEYERGIFIAESPTVIEVALNSGCVPVSILTDERLINGAVRGIIDRVGDDVPVYVAERELLREIVGFELTRGALCAFLRPTLPSVCEIATGKSRVAVLEDIADATNIGAIFRSASALNIDAVLITPSCCDPLCRRALRVSMGTVLQVPWTRIGESKDDWPQKGLALLNSLGYKTASMALSDDSVSIDDERLMAEPQLAIILGTEGDGLKKSTIASSDYTVKIPMSNGVDSLNVASAGAVAFWQLGRR